MLRRSWLIIGGVVIVASFSMLGVASAIFCAATLHVARANGDLRAPAYAGGIWGTVAVRARDGVVLEGWLVRPGDEPTTRCVAVLHGIADSKAGAAGFAPMFLQEGYSVLLPDSRAHGRSGGQLVTYGLLEKYDVLEWVRLLRSEGCTEIYGLGESLGGSILIQASALESAFKAIVAECPYSDLRAIAESRTQQILKLPILFSGVASRVVVSGGMLYARAAYGLDFDEVRPAAAMAATQTPILLIHGANDHATPCWHSQRLAQANAQSVLWLVPGADHVRASATDPQGFRVRVLDWFARH